MINVIRSINAGTYHVNYKGGIARPTLTYTTPTGTRSKKFQFNEFVRARGLIEPDTSAEGTALRQRLASIISSQDSAFGATL